MSGSTNMSCPFCGGSVQRVADAKARESLLGNLGLSIALEFLFWFAVGIAALFWFWSAAATVVVAVAVTIGVVVWWPHRFTYRCDKCESVLTYREVKQVPKNAA